MDSQHLVAASYKLLAVEGLIIKESRHREDGRTTTERSKRSRALPRRRFYSNLSDSTYLKKTVVNMETRASKKDNSGNELMPSRTTVQSTDNVVGTSQILTMMLQMQQEAAQDRREDARIAKQTKMIRKDEQSASEQRFLQLLQQMQASNISTQQRAQEIQDKKDTEAIERDDKARRQALADQEALLRQQALMKQQELDQLKEQAQLEREERKHADDERLQRVEYLGHTVGSGKVRPRSKQWNSLPDLDQRRT